MNFLENDLTSVNILKNGLLFLCQFRFESKFLRFASEGKKSFSCLVTNSTWHEKSQGFINNVINYAFRLTEEKDF